VKRKGKHAYRFTAVKDSRNRKVRSIWHRGHKWYMQTRVSGEKSARRVPLAATTIEATKAEMADVKKQKRTEGLPDTGLRPLLSDYADASLRFHTNADSGNKPRTVAREGHSLVHRKRRMGNVRLDKITKSMIAGFVKGRLEAGATPELNRNTGPRVLPYQMDSGQSVVQKKPNDRKPKRSQTNSGRRTP